jgi:Raf kinase inhibitor-like YbhB/YbcL family protein
MRTGAVVVVAALAALGGCGGDSSSAPTPDRSPATLTVTSPAFQDGATLPTRFTCSGAGVPPPLRWAGVPSRARALALTVLDPDAPGGTFVHRVVVDLPAASRALTGDGLPAGAHELRAWKPPCPPKGDAPHRYRFTISALDRRLAPEAGADAIATTSIAHGTLTGRFGR